MTRKSHARQFRDGFVSKWLGECTFRWHVLLSVQQGGWPIARADSGRFSARDTRLSSKNTFKGASATNPSEYSTAV